MHMCCTCCTCVYMYTDTRTHTYAYTHTLFSCTIRHMGISNNRMLTCHIFACALGKWAPSMPQLSGVIGLCHLYTCKVSTSQVQRRTPPLLKTFYKNSLGCRNPLAATAETQASKGLEEWEKRAKSSRNVRSEQRARGM
jgi:hypothetical protein